MAQLRFDGKVAIVTGAGGGLGRAYALELAKRGASVVVNDLGGSFKGQGADGKVADKVVAEIKAAGGKAAANYNSVTEGEKIVETAIKEFGRIDIVINNAGILRDVSFKRMNEQDWDLIMQVHLKGAYSVTKAAWKYMLEQKYGRIITTASSAGLYGNNGQANYATAKIGLVGFMQSLAKEGRSKNITANAVAPFAGTRMTATVMPKNVLAALAPEQVVPLTLYLCHESCKATGEAIEVGAGAFNKVQIARSKGWINDPEKVPSVEDIAAHWKEITDMKGASMVDYKTGLQQNPPMKNVQRLISAQAKKAKL